MAVADLPVAAGRRGLRHQRLPGHRAGVRDARAVRRAAGRGARARDEARDGPRRQSHVRRAPVVRRVALVGRLAQARLVHLAPRARDRVALVLLRAGVGARRGHRRVLPAPVLAQAARPQLGEPGGPRRDLLDDELVAGPRGRRLPDGRHQHDLQGLLGARVGRLRPRPAAPRVPAGDAPRGLRRPPGRAADRGGDAGRGRRGGAPVHRSRAARGRHGLPVRAHGRRPGRVEVGSRAAAAERLEGDARALADRVGRRRLELLVLGQPRPAAGGLALRRRRVAPGRRGEDARHDPALPARDAVRLPGRGTRHDQRAVGHARGLPRHRVGQPLPRGGGGGRGARRRAVRPAPHEPRQRAHAGAVGFRPARGLHDGRAVAPGQPEPLVDQRRGGARGPGLGLSPLPAADRVAQGAPGDLRRRLHDAAGRRRARLRLRARAGRRRAARARQLQRRRGGGRPGGLGAGLAGDRRRRPDARAVGGQGLPARGAVRRPSSAALAADRLGHLGA